MLRLAAIALLASTACAADLAGRYVLEGVPETASELLLKNDGTFEYVFIYRAADYQAAGIWRSEEGAIVLNTSGGGAAPFKLIRSAPGDSAGTRVWVKAANGRGIPHVDILLQTAEGDLADRTDSSGSALFPDIRGARSVKIGIRVYSIEAGPFALDAAKNEHFFEIDVDAVTRVPFKDERLKAAGGVLEMRFWNRERAMRYRRR